MILKHSNNYNPKNLKNENIEIVTDAFKMYACRKDKDLRLLMKYAKIYVIHLK